eukprot:Plantae.Rhodophyta-Hildenbrandia_rubra.ctg12622.p1 GENE.Plantae.Rhodophyta-Hildenbrandia_rubra.ctg12622~~Plantae.Rhodophyta-Hildenbrandia_rubra.ctg12622.p1  ORF type:complete len:944 (-),score=142.09 Plantae.Rhodophyta-Hildenbrandia_rubra.ctg12622:380-3211(-)
MKLEIERILSTQSERVKCVDIHPTEPWVLATQYDGRVQIYNYVTGGVVKSWETSELPVRCGVFVPRKQWVIVGSDDMQIRVYNYNTMEKVKVFEAHYDYIRGLAVHPTLPLLVSCSDDMYIRLWDWDQDWKNTMVFEGHSHYVMAVKFNPKDPNTFASASLDHHVKVWNLSSPIPNFTLEGQDSAGVNCLDYYPGGDKPYLVTGGDDKLVRIWDYQTKTCLQALEGHTHNVSSVMFLPDRPLIVSGSEDGNVILWHSNTYRLETTLNYGYDRCWSISCMKDSNRVAFGFDEGLIMIRMGKDNPVASMDASGKVVYARHTEVSMMNLRNADLASLADGERLALATKDLGTCDIYPDKLSHSPNGRFVSVCGDGEYIIYTALAWRNKSFGAADEVVWDNSTGEYATRLGTSSISVFSKSFKERTTMRPAFDAEGMFGGTLLAVRGSDFICFYEWNTLQLIRRIDVAASNVCWADSGDKVAVISDSTFYVLKYSQDAVDQEMNALGSQLDAEGVEDAFELVHEIPETVVTGSWVGECFVYTNSASRLNYLVGSDVATLHHLERPMFVLGYLPKENRVCLIDKEYSVVSYQLLMSVLAFKTAVVQGEWLEMEKQLKKVPSGEHNKLARFLESQGHKERALQIATDTDYRCELATSLGKLDVAADIARKHPSLSKWRQLTDLAVTNGDFEVAEEAMMEAEDYPGLLLLHDGMGERKKINGLADAARKSGASNISFICSFMTGDVDACLSLLITSGRLPEAAVFARTYAPSKVTGIVESWRGELRKSPKSVRVADSLADPEAHPHLFEGHEAALTAEKQAESLRKMYDNKPSTAYAEVKNDVELELSALVDNVNLNGGHTSSTAKDTQVDDLGKYSSDHLESNEEQTDINLEEQGQAEADKTEDTVDEEEEAEGTQKPLDGERVVMSDDIEDLSADNPGIQNSSLSSQS